MELLKDIKKKKGKEGPTSQFRNNFQKMLLIICRRPLFSRNRGVSMTRPSMGRNVEIFWPKLFTLLIKFRLFSYEGREIF